MTSSLKSKKSSLHSIAKYGNSYTIMIYFKVPNEDRQGKVHFSILLPMLHAKVTPNGYIAMVSYTFSLIIVVV